MYAVRCRQTSAHSEEKNNNIRIANGELNSVMNSLIPFEFYEFCEFESSCLAPSFYYSSIMSHDYPYASIKHVFRWIIIYSTRKWQTNKEKFYAPNTRQDIKQTNKQTERIIMTRARLAWRQTHREKNDSVSPKWYVWMCMMHLKLCVVEQNKCGIVEYSCRLLFVHTLSKINWMINNEIFRKNKFTNWRKWYIIASSR